MTTSDHTTAGVYKGVHVHPGVDTPDVETPLQNVKSSTSRARREEYTARGGVHVHPCTPLLADWLATLRTRGIDLRVHDRQVHLAGPADDLDLDWLSRYHNALEIAADGTHPHWWAAVRQPDRWRHTPPDVWPNLGCAVAGCPGELGHYSPDGIPFCDQHHPDWWIAPLPDLEGVAA